ncbi:murein biosynthesis integral membrane protein MurJ [Deinococcus roseus]|nr:murein biosynthesis integral membrane protein MurJ [Deinococcus roseus]
MKNTVILMLGTLFSRVLGLVRQMVINLFPVSVQDAFNVASKVPNLFRELLAEGALVNSFIPVYQGLAEPERKKLSEAFFGALIAINVFLVGLGIVFARPIVHLLVADGDNINIDLAVQITQLVMPFLMMMSFSASSMGILSARENFKAYSYAQVAFNVASILVLLVAPRTAFWLGFGWTFGGFVQFLVQSWPLFKMGLFPFPRLGWDPKLQTVLTRMAPFLISTSARQFLNLIVTRFITAFSGGTISGYQNAEVIFQLALGLFAVSPATALYPRLARHWNEQDQEGFTKLTVQGLRAVVFFAAPVSALLVALAPYAVSIFNLHLPTSPAEIQKFQAGSLILSTWALAIVPWGMIQFMARTFFVRGRTLDSLLITSGGAFLEVLLYSILTRKDLLGLQGFGVSSFISGLLVLGVQLFLYRRQLGFPLRELLVFLVRVVPAALLAGLAAWFVGQAMGAGLNHSGGILQGLAVLVTAGGVGGVVYLLLAFLLKVRELSSLLGRLRR